MKQTFLIRSNKPRRWLMVWATVTIACAVASVGWAAPHPPSATPNPTVPFLFNYQGTLQDAVANPLPTGDYELSFSIYSVASGGTAIWGPQRFNGQSGTGLGPRVPIVQGRFNVVLGPLDTGARPLVDMFGSSARYLEVTVANNPPILPRQQILPSAYAFNAASLNGFTWEHLFKGGNPNTGETGALALGQDPADVLRTDEGPNVFPPLDVAGRIRLRRKGNGYMAGLWLHQGSPASDRALLGMNGDDAVGLYGTGGAGWGLSMNVNNGVVTVPSGLNLGGYGQSHIFEEEIDFQVVALVVQGFHAVQLRADRTICTGTIQAAGFGPVSDRRLKRDIEKINNPLRILSKIDGVRYQFDKQGEFALKAGYDLPEGKQAGVLAQEVQEAIPEAVMHDFKGVLSVNYNALTGVLIEAVKQQQREIENLRSDLKALRGQTRP